MGTSVEKAVKI